MNRVEWNDSQLGAVKKNGFDFLKDFNCMIWNFGEVA